MVVLEDVKLSFIQNCIILHDKIGSDYLFMIRPICPVYSYFNNGHEFLDMQYVDFPIDVHFSHDKFNAQI